MTSAPRREATMLASEKAAAYCRFSLPAAARAAKAVEEEKRTIMPLVAELTWTSVNVLGIITPHIYAIKQSYKTQCSRVIKLLRFLSKYQNYNKTVDETVHRLEGVDITPMRLKTV